jgi:hypothetical protein
MKVKSQVNSNVKNIAFVPSDAQASTPGMLSFWILLLTSGPLQCRRATQAKRELSGPACLSPAPFAGRVRDRTALPSSAGHTEGAASGVAFFGLFSDRRKSPEGIGEAIKVTRARQGGETAALKRNATEQSEKKVHTGFLLPQE